METAIAVKSEKREISKKWLHMGQPISAKTIAEVLDQGKINWTVSKRPLLSTAENILGDDFTKKNPLSSVGLSEHKKLLDFISVMDEHISNVERDKIEEFNPVLLEKLKSPFIPVPEHAAIVRNDNNAILGVMGYSYRPLSNQECIEILEPLMNTGKVEVERAGIFEKGKRVWIVAKIPGEMFVGPEPVDQYIRIGWSHDGSEKLSAAFIVLVRNSGIYLSPSIKGTKTSVGIKHTRQAKDRIKAAQEVIISSENYFANLQEIFDTFINTVFSDDDMDKYINLLFPDKDGGGAVLTAKGEPKGNYKVRETIKTIFAQAPIEIKNTKWSALLSVGEWADHHKTSHVHGKDECVNDEELENLENEAKLQSSWFGSSATEKDKAFEALLSF
jgi:phage/plasmid-like protein (TIGR03299 family)